MQCRETKWHREQFPDGVEVIDAMVATALEENEFMRKEDRPGPGESPLPKMSRARAKEWAIEIALHLGANNAITGWHETDPYWIMQSAYKQAVQTGGEANPDKFGHYMAMQAMGQGVRWTDDNPDPGFKVPHHELY